MIDIGKTDHVTMMYTVIKLYTTLGNIGEHCNKLYHNMLYHKSHYLQVI